LPSGKINSLLISGVAKTLTSYSYGSAGEILTATVVTAVSTTITSRTTGTGSSTVVTAIALTITSSGFTVNNEPIEEYLFDIQPESGGDFLQQEATLG